MNLATSLTRFVSSQVRQRGQQYYREGRVSLLSCGREKVGALVSGSEEYDVLLTRDSRRLLASCACPYFYDRGEACKHIWAAILAADAQGGLRGTGGSLPRRLVLEDPDGSGWDEDDPDSGEDDDLAGEPPPRPSLPSAPQRLSLPARPVLKPVPQPPTWRQLLEPAMAIAQPTAPVEILYRIDASAMARTGTLMVEVLTGRRKNDGTLGKLRLLQIRRGDVARLPDPVDRQVLAVLSGAGNGPWTDWYYGGMLAVPTRAELPEPAADVLIPLLCSTGRCRLRLQPEPDQGEPVAWDGGDPWDLWLEVREEAGGDCTLGGSLRRGEERLAPDEPPLVLRSGFLFHGGRAARHSFAATFRWFELLRRSRPLRVPAADRNELLERIFASPELPRLDLPEALQVAEVRMAPQPRLRLRAARRDDYPQWPHGQLSFVYDGREVASGDPGRGLYQPEERRFLLRDSETERQAAERLPGLGFRPAGAGTHDGYSVRISAGRMPEAVRALLAEGWLVEAQGKLYRSPGAFRLAVSSGIDWFELHGEAEFAGERVGLPELLAALQRGDGFVPLSDGSLGLLPEEWLKKLAPVSSLGSSEEDHVRFSAAQACFLDALLAAEPEVTCDAAFARARERLQSFEGVTPADPPPGFQGELRGYQRAGLGWLHFLRELGFGGCLADDMGLGKTVQVLALLEARRKLPARQKPGPSLVVVPRSLIFNWLSEAARFTPRLRVLDYTGAGRARDENAFSGWDLVLTTYGTLRRDVPALRAVEFDYLILDEAQAIKNADSQTAKAARLLRGRHRLALTGTPVENHLGELWSLLDFLNPGLLGASSLLRTRATELRDPAPETRSLLARALRPFLLRRTKEQVATDLPAKLEQTLFCELPPKQRRLYDELRDHYRSALGARLTEQGLGRTKILVLEALLRLRQAACHPGLLDRDRSDEPSAKLDLLLPQLAEVIDEGHKVLVFSQFTSFLSLVRRHLDREGVRYLYLDGRTRDRRTLVEQFQSEEDVRLFLISLKAGGLGLNLTAADYVYLLDPWWNPAVEAQAMDRAHRIGQTRPVFAYRLVARNTVEERILELQKNKRELADAIVQADQSLIAKLSREDLELLLS